MPAGVHLFKLAFALDIFLLVNFTWEELCYLSDSWHMVCSLNFRKRFLKEKKPLWLAVSWKMIC